MPIYNKINDEQRLTSSILVKVDYNWRSSDVYTKIDGSWQLIHKNNILVSDILGFKLVYNVNHYKRWNSIPRLKYNPNIPASLSISGSTEMDTNEKGVLFQYRYEVDNYEEGILYYEGTLYALLKHELIINISSDGTLPKEKGILDITDTNRLDAEISIVGHLSYDSNGYQINGWNSLFDVDQFTDAVLIGNGFDNKSEGNNVPKLDEINSVQIPNRIIFPITDRSSTYSPLASIGIARNTLTHPYNMLASRGMLDHTISKINLNGIPMPFMIEINNELTMEFIKVTDILDIPLNMRYGKSFDLSTTRVIPSNAIFKTIVWAVVDGPCTIVDNILHINADNNHEKSVKIRATISEGLGIGIDFIKDFTIYIRDIV